MDRLVLQRKPLRISFTKTYNSFLEQSKESEVDIKVINITFNKLERLSQDLNKLDDQICNLILDTNDEAKFEAEYQAIEVYKDNFDSAKVEINIVHDNLAKHNISSGKLDNSSCSSPNSKRKLKLPKLELTKFSGEVRDWLAFWSQFKRIDSDKDLESEDKFQYLIQATVSGSRAREIVNSYPPTAENYEKAIQALKNRFGREELLTEFYVRELLSLVVKNMSFSNSKSKLSTSFLYDKLESHLRALESIGMTQDKYAAMLFPLVESCVPEDLLRTWLRSPMSTTTVGEVSSSYTSKLQQLLSFLKAEVEGEERISMAKSGFKSLESSSYSKDKYKKEEDSSQPTACSLFASEEKQITNKRQTDLMCIFCDKINHESKECFIAQKLSFSQKKEVVSKKNCCFICLKQGHRAKTCKVSIRCLVCSKRHSTIMCPTLDGEKHSQSNSRPMFKNKDVDVKKSNEKETTNLYSQDCAQEVLLQTLLVKLKMHGKTKTVRALIDSGSQRSYILKSTVAEMGYKPEGKEDLMHSLFGGVKTSNSHQRYTIHIFSIESDYMCEMSVLDQPTICGPLPRLKCGSLINEIEGKGIKLTDTGEALPKIQLLIGADMLGNILTGKSEKLNCGLVVQETLLGWMVFGNVSSDKISNPYRPNTISSIVTNLYTHSTNLSDLWTLDVLGINDPYENKSKAETELAAIEHFHSTVSINNEGRFEVKLPWVEEQGSLDNNRTVANRRLETTTEKLIKEGIFEDYSEVFQNWEKAGIIQNVQDSEQTDEGYYLPHRAVVKEQSSTKIRPVFDASSKAKGCLSLNDCLEKGPNLIEQIPSILMRFRENKIGVISDIEKAFLQISLEKADCKYLKFLWWDSYENKTLKVFQHCRVVFGVNCSPFLLGATINYHLDHCPKAFSDTAKKLKSSFYVDNCVTSVGSEEELANFMQDSTELLSQVKFNLRDWKFSGATNQHNIVPTSVLGLLWDTNKDELCCDVQRIDAVRGPVSRRTILSTVHQVFDPIGFTCPVTLFPKLLLQLSWKSKLSWDEEVPEDIKEKFLKWKDELKYLPLVRVPRCTGSFQSTNDNQKTLSLHIFCDASQNAFSAVVYLRSDCNGIVKVQLVLAKSRVSPLKKMTIPRLELMACCIGARLAFTVMKSLNLKNITQYFWTDSTTALCWIRNEENWGMFVQNRVKEIRQTTNGNWHHVPGTVNPADLPSRGCSVKTLIDSHWWEGPQWLYLTENEWPRSSAVYDSLEIDLERKKSIEVLLDSNTTKKDNWYLKYFSKYSKILRMVAWIRRFVTNMRKPKTERLKEELTVEEISQAEIVVIKQMQNEVFNSDGKSALKKLCVFQDKNGVLRIMTKLSSKQADEECFRCPIVLPSKHRLVQLLILQEHTNMCHAGVNVLTSKLRERFWILKARKTISGVVHKCVVCKRHSSKPLQSLPVALPEDRVREACVFEITGVDLAGPLILKDGSKSWFVVFTCAVFRAIHLELITSLSTNGFILGFRRFIARRGRPKIVYSDNGTNFVGTDNLFKSIDWNYVEIESTVSRIQWKFIPPTAAWWGGWWERIVQMVKNLLRRVLGKASLNYEELSSILCDCEAVINSRPLTYTSDEADDFVALTPAMFLQENNNVGVPDLDIIDSKVMPKRFKYQQHLRSELRKRFRAEYLSQLVLKQNKNDKEDIFHVGDIVLIGSDGRKRLYWPLAKIEKMYYGRDGKTRVVKLKTASGELTRPIQRVYPLEVQSHKEHIEISPDAKTEKETSKCIQPIVVKTFSGRQVKLPSRFLD